MSEEDSVTNMPSFFIKNTLFDFYLILAFIS